MAERIPPIVVEVETKFNAKGIRRAKKEIKKFSTETENDIVKSEQKIENLKKAWSTYASSLDGNNKKVKKSIDAVTASFERSEKSKEKLLNAESKKTKAILSLENKRIDLQEKKKRLAAFGGVEAEKYVKEQTIKEVEKLHNAKLSAIRKAEEDENSLRAKLEKARMNERKANLEQERSALKVETTHEQKRVLEEQRKILLNRFKRHGISIKRGDDGTVSQLYDRKTGSTKGSKDDLASIRDLEAKLSIATQKANIAFDEQEIKLATLLAYREELAAVQEEYNRAVNYSSGLSNEITDAEKVAIIQGAKNASLEEAEKRANAVKKAENGLASAEETLAKASRDVEAAKRDLNSEAAKTVGVVQQEADNIKKLTGAMAKVKSVVASAASAIKKFWGKIKNANITNIVAKFYSVTRIASYLNSFIESSSEWVENLNLLEVVYNDTATAADNVKEKISDLSEAFRMDINALAQYVSVFKQMANAMGQTADVGSQMAEVLSLIALDVSSLRNVDVKTVVSDFTGALAGQVKPVRKYGFDITMYSIDELMKELGYGAISRSMTQANKQLARAVLLVRQSKDAWGDLSKTINTYANQQRILNDQFTQFKRLIGNVLLGTFTFGDSLEEASKTAGVVQKGIWYLNGAMIALNTILEAIAPSANSVNGAVAAGAEEATDAIEEETEALEGTLASFDKFNTLESGSGSTTNVADSLAKLLGSESSAYMEEFQNRLKNISMYAEKISEQILGFLFPEYTAWKGNDSEKTFAQWAEQTDSLNNRVSELKETMLGFGQLLMWVINPKMGLFSSIVMDFLNTEGEEEKAKKLENLALIIEKLQEGFLDLGSALFKMADAFAPVFAGFASYVAAIAELEGGVWALVGAVAALAIAKAALKGKAYGVAAIAAAIGGAIFFLTPIIGNIAKGAKGQNRVIDSLYKHANGGFQTGGLFYAGEAGPEWVGRQGNTSTIINDGQMSDIMRDSVAKGVMQANIASRQISGAGRSGKVAVVNLNGKHLFDVVEQEGYKEGKVFAKSR